MAPYDRGTTTVPPTMAELKTAGLSETRRSATKNSLEYGTDSDGTVGGGGRRADPDEEEDDILSQTSDETIPSRPEPRKTATKGSKKEGPDTIVTNNNNIIINNNNNNNQNDAPNKNRSGTSTARKNTDLPKQSSIPSVLFDVPSSGNNSEGSGPIAVPARRQRQKTTIAVDDDASPNRRFVLPTVFTAVSGTGGIAIDREATRRLIESALASSERDVDVGAVTIRKSTLTREEADAWRKFAATKSTAAADKPLAASEQQRRHSPPAKKTLRHSSSCPSDVAANHQSHERNPLHRKTGPAAADSYSSNKQWLAYQKNPLLRKTHSPNKVMSPKKVVSIGSGQRTAKSHSSPATSEEALEYVRRWCASKRSDAHEKITISLSDEKRTQQNEFVSIAAEERSRALRKVAQQRIENSVISEEKQRMWALRKKEQQARQKTILPPTDPWRSATKAQKKKRNKKAENDMSRYVWDTLHQTRRRSNSEYESNGISWYHPSSSIGPRSSTTTGRTKKNTTTTSTLARPSSFSSSSTKNVGSNGPRKLTRRSLSTSKLQVNR